MRLIDADVVERKIDSIIAWVDNNLEVEIFRQGCKASLKDLASTIKCYIPIIDAAPVVHGHWTDDHKCSACGGEVFSETVNIRPEYDYDCDENLVFTGEYEYDIEYYETDWCPWCGAKMDEVC